MSRKRLSVADEPFLIVRSSLANPPAGGAIGDHVHDWHQLIHVSAGLMHVSTDAGTWVAPPGRAVWAPAGARHAIRFVGASALRTLYFRPESWPGLPDRCTAVTVSVLLRELILKVGALSALDRRLALDVAIASVMMEELRLSDALPFTLPQPATSLTQRAAALMAVGEGGATATPNLARALGVGARTLERRFIAETGVTLGLWRRRQALLDSLDRLALGASTKAVAQAAGYSTPSAFVAAFKAAFGTTPGRYFREAGSPASIHTVDVAE